MVVVVVVITEVNYHYIHKGLIIKHYNWNNGWSVSLERVFKFTFVFTYLTIIIMLRITKLAYISLAEGYLDIASSYKY